MAWLDNAWLYRVPLTIANHSGVNAPEAQITIPKSAGHFWSKTLSSFNDVRITAADGITLLDWAFDGGTPSQDNRTATIVVDDTNHNVATLYGNNAASASVGAWMYYGNDTTNLTSNANNSVNVNTGSAKAMLLPVGAATSMTNAYHVHISSPGVNQEYPNSEFRKQVNDETFIFWHLGRSIAQLSLPNHRRFDNEEIAYVKAVIYDQDGADTTSAMTTLNEIVILDDHVVRMPIKAGDHEKRYIIIMTFGLVDAEGDIRVIDQRATIHVKNLGLHPA